MSCTPSPSPSSSQSSIFFSLCLTSSASTYSKHIPSHTLAHEIRHMHILHHHQRRLPWDAVTPLPCYWVHSFSLQCFIAHRCGRWGVKPSHHPRFSAAATNWKVLLNAAWFGTQEPEISTQCSPPSCRDEATGGWAKIAATQVQHDATLEKSTTHPVIFWAKPENVTLHV